MKAFNDHFAVVDLETLGIESRSCILSLGLTLSTYDRKDITFPELIGEGLYVKFDLKEQLDRGRTKRDSVVKWWYEQSADAKSVLKPLPTDKSVYGISSILEDYFKSMNVDIRKVDFYDRNSFDMTKIQNIIEDELNESTPWHHQSVFEIATALRFLGYDRYAGMRVDDIQGAVYHNALHDSAVDHLRLMKALHTEV